MASNELAIRFTEGKYATKAEVGKELKMSMIDNIWSNILKYRADFNRYLPIKSIEKNQLVMCICQSINALVSSSNMKMVRVMREHSLLNVQNGDLRRFEDDALIKGLKSLAAKNEVEVAPTYLRSLIHGDIRDASPSLRIIVRYLDALNFIKNSLTRTIDVDYIAELFSRLKGTNELTEFYRTEDDRSYENRVLIDRLYTCAPSALIDGMMESLFTFLETSTFSQGTKAAIAYYYINYIKPFNEYSDEIALLTAKAILAHSDLGEVGILLPIESLLSENQEEIARLFTEVQKTSDTTYFVNFALKHFNSKCDELLDTLARLKVEAVKKDFYQPEEEKPAPTTTFVVDQPSLFDFGSQSEPQPETTKVEPRPIPQSSPVREEVKPEPVRREEPVKPQEVKVEQKPAEVVQEQIAVSYIPPAIDEKQALRLEQHLLELDPSLRKHEAKFYARHCTIGKSYTIAQYKRMIGCVYETARTAMDHLVELGYYRKDSSNKKFIYTPIPRK